MEFHPACLLLPKQSESEFSALVESVRRGWNALHPIVTYEGKILDGRHRYEACVATGVDPTFSEWNGSAFDWNPFRYVRVEHDARRNWTSQEQRFLVLADILRSEGVFDTERERIRSEANKKRAQAAKEQHAVSNPRAGETVESGGGTTCSTTRTKQHKSRDAKAAKTGVNRGAVQRAEKIERMAKELGDDELLASVKSGETKAHAALKSLEERMKAEQLARPISVVLPPGIHRGDFRELAAAIPDGSVDLVFTDPPYDKDSVHLYEDAALVAARILKPGGSMIAYSGQSRLPDVLGGMSKHLRYWWTIAGVHEGGNQIMKKFGIRCGWKPLVWFVKGGRADVQNVVLDVIRGDREKFAHPWQQSQAEAEYFVRELCSENGTVVDFFLGGGTTAAACKAVGRNFIGFEIDATAIERAVERIAA